MKRLTAQSALLVLPLLVGCSSTAQAMPCPATAESEASSEASTDAAPSTGAVAAQPATSTPVGAESNQASTALSQSESQAPNREGAKTEDASAPPLPELRLKLSGMHIGGGPNDGETKKPFIDAIELGFDAMRACYRDADEPLKGGTYGVDLRVPREGGSPTVQAVRTAMKGDKMRSCLEQTFSKLSFKRPAKGATVLSVSVRFSMEP